ncbi:ABSCISIC ACID-INSENSITIVE 5-like protein 2 [Abeliophyllum distichum]|uniref:ABSCISIC ACID-INSENSITIVE 5-like protein 2 n=1 Tax=Abeliophyllum distichum TaxID=126358 RepID=A0ABD1PR53_9LAMI
MGLQGGCSNSFGPFGGAQTQRDPKSNLVAGQGSLYGLTLDEVQNQLEDVGKPLNSMNVDELLNSVWTAEANNQAMEVVDYDPTFGQPALDSSLNPQLSFRLFTDLNKTVDELWQHIQQGQSSLDRKATLGEMTLEDFLVKAGVVAESFSGKINPGSVYDMVDETRQDQWTEYQIPEMHPQQQQSVLPVLIPGHPIQQPSHNGGNTMIDAVYSEMEIVMSPSNLRGTTSGTQNPRRRRIPPGVIEKSVERRLKRMIKNRESAARSRARKQAYQHELESKVSRLEEENQRLKQMKVVELILPREPLPEPRYQLRRSSSAPI